MKSFVLGAIVAAPCVVYQSAVTLKQIAVAVVVAVITALTLPE